MKRHRVTHKAIYVVRYCSKIKLGEDRFKCYLKAATALVEQKPINGVTKKQQSLAEKEENRQKSQQTRITDFTPKTNAALNNIQKGTTISSNASNKKADSNVQRKSYASAASPDK